MPEKKNCKYFPTCGGCDFLHLSNVEYRQTKQQNLNQALGADLFDNNLINWIWLSQGTRRKVTLQINGKNQLGFFKKQSHQMIEITECLACEEVINQLIPKLQKFLAHQPSGNFTQANITAFDNGLEVVLALKKEPDFLQNQKLVEFARTANINLSCRISQTIEPAFLTRKNQLEISGIKVNLGSEIFIQASKQGLAEIIGIIRKILLAEKNPQKIADIYAGFGAYSFAITDLAASIAAFEGSEEMINLIKQNSLENGLKSKISAIRRDLFHDPISEKELNKFDFIIINPPRNGAGPQVEKIAKSNVKNLIYISCNPQTFARDSRILAGNGFKITELTALDQFYGTKHLELIASFERP